MTDNVSCHSEQKTRCCRLVTSIKGRLFFWALHFNCASENKHTTTKKGTWAPRCRLQESCCRCGRCKCPCNERQETENEYYGLDAWQGSLSCGADAILMLQHHCSLKHPWDFLIQFDNIITQSCVDYDTDFKYSYTLLFVFTTELNFSRWNKL